LIECEAGGPTAAINASLSSSCREHSCKLPERLTCCFEALSGADSTLNFLPGAIRDEIWGGWYLIRLWAG
jgi:hypothetical protein